MSRKSLVLTYRCKLQYTYPSVTTQIILLKSRFPHFIWLGPRSLPLVILWLPSTPIMATTKAPHIELMLELPALMAPPGVKYDFVNPSNLQTNFYIDLVLCLTISSLAVSMRIWTKARLIKKFGREDCKEFSISPLSSLRD